MFGQCDTTRHTSTADIVLGKWTLLTSLPATFRLLELMGLLYLSRFATQALHYRSSRRTANLIITLSHEGTHLSVSTRSLENPSYFQVSSDVKRCDLRISPPPKISWERERERKREKNAQSTYCTALHPHLHPHLTNTPGWSKTVSIVLCRCLGCFIVFFYAVYLFLQGATSVILNIWSVH